MLFKKGFKVKFNCQLKGSDSKKLRGEIIQHFPQLTEEALNKVMPPKETIFQMKLLAHTGQVVRVICVQKLPIIFELENVWYPTVYMLWHVPDLLYTFTTHAQVFPNISRGADLMLPGVVLPEGEGESPRAYGRLQKGDRVAVNLTNNKAPVAVGIAANSSHDMYMCARRGRCVQVLHYYGDLLSTYGTKLNVPELGPAFSSETDRIEDEKQSCEDESVLNAVKDDEELNSGANTEVPVKDATTVLTQRIQDLKITSDVVRNVNGDSTTNESCVESRVSPIPNPDQEAQPAEETTSSTAQMDELLKYCFLKSLKTTMKKVELPLLSSTFYKLHLIPACPNNKLVNIKKSSYKKLSNFLDEMVKLQIINVEAFHKGVQSISKINLSHDLVTGFVDTCSNETNNNSCLTVDTTQTNNSSVPAITEKYTVTEAVLPLFYNYDYKKDEAVTPAVVRKVITDYVKVKNLQNPSNKKEVKLDQVLRGATNSTSDIEVLPLEQLISSVFGRMSQLFKVELGTKQQPIQQKQMPPIDIQVGTRSGNKKVTLVSNLELYGINCLEFGRECQRGVQASTTINNLPSAKSAQVQIQGNQVLYVAKLLTEKYQLPKRCLNGLENAPKKKK